MAQGTPRAPKKPKMIIEWFGEAADSALSDPGNELVEGLLDEGGLSVNYGDSGSGKTFVGRRPADQAENFGTPKTLP